MDISTRTCNQFCPTGWMKLPDEYVNSSSYCINQCDGNSQTCPDNNSSYTQINKFSCNAGFLNNYYRCVADSNIYAAGNLQVSSALKTQALEIDLVNTYTNYILDVWFLPDNRFQTDPLVGASSFLVTNNLNFQLVFAVGTNHYARFTCGATVITTIDYVNTLAWMHLVFHNYPVQNTNYFHVNHNMFSTAINPTTGVWTNSNPRGSGSCSLNKIYFCGNADTYFAACAGKNWIDAYYKNLRVWDGNYASFWSVIKQDQ